MEETGNLLGQPELTKHETQEVVMNTSEPYFTREATDKVVKILASTYKKADIDKVAVSSVQLDKNYV